LRLDYGRLLPDAAMHKPIDVSRLIAGINCLIVCLIRKG
jgi:hypothetical protein